MLPRRAGAPTGAPTGAAEPSGCVFECRAAVHRHLREGKLSANDGQVVHRVMHEDDFGGLWMWLPVTETSIADAAAQFQKLPVPVFLRSADALHLVCARAQGLGRFTAMIGIC
jgi:hypothetical protein